MEEITTNTVRHLNPENEGHRAFAIWISSFTKEEMEALFVNPSDYGEDEHLEHLPTEEMKRDVLANRESYARSKKAEDNYDALYKTLSKLDGFIDIPTPVLNEEMKGIVIAALKMELSVTDDIDVMSNAMDLLNVLEPGYLDDAISGNLSSKKKKKVTFSEINQTAFFKPKDAPNKLSEKTTASNNASVIIERFLPPVESSKVERPKSPHTVPGNTYAFVEDGKFVEKQNASEIKRPQSISSNDVKQKSVTPINVFDCLQADSGEVLRKTSPYGFNAIEHKTESLAMENVSGPVEKKPQAMRLKDSSGHYVDFFQDGSAKTSEYDMTNDTEAVASEMLKALLAMLNVYVVLCDQKGLESVLPNGERLNPQFSIAKPSDNSEKIRALIVSKLERELQRSHYDVVRERLYFDGEKLLRGFVPKEKQEMSRNEEASIRFYR